MQVKTALGHEVTLSTVQLDYQLPERFELEYIDENNDRVRPVVIHRAILGSLDRFVAFILEETKGVLPAWLSPVQVKILTVSEKNENYASEICNKLKNLNFRVELDTNNESVGKKIRTAVLEKAPFILVIGDKEMEENLVSVRKRGSKDTNSEPFDDFLKELSDAIAEKSL